MPVVTPAPTPSSTPDETTDWQIYRSDDYGFEIKYPKEWTTKQYETGPVIFSALDGGKVYISRDMTKKYVDINDYLSKWDYKDKDRAALWNVRGEEFITISELIFTGINGRTSQKEKII